MSKLKVGVVWCGFVTKKRYIPAFLRLNKDVDLCAVCDLNEVAGAVAKEFRIPNVYSDVSEILSKEGLGVVDVCTPPQVHAQIAIEVRESDCHVLLEKPMAHNVSDCNEMINASEKYGTKLSVVHNQFRLCENEKLV